MVGEDHDAVEEFLDEDSFLGVGGFLPDGLDVEGAEDGGDFLEALGQLVPFGALDLDSVGFGVDGVDEVGEPLFFFLEGFRGDPVGVVEVEELGAFLAERPERSVPAAGFGGLASGVDVLAEVLADGVL